jgi:hypothetical protein
MAERDTDPPVSIIYDDIMDKWHLLTYISMGRGQFNDFHIDCTQEICFYVIVIKYQ